MSEVLRKRTKKNTQKSLKSFERGPKKKQKTQQQQQQKYKTNKQKKKKKKSCGTRARFQPHAQNVRMQLEVEDLTSRQKALQWYLDKAAGGLSKEVCWYVGVDWLKFICQSQGGETSIGC